MHCFIWYYLLSVCYRQGVKEVRDNGQLNVLLFLRKTFSCDCHRSYHMYRQTMTLLMSKRIRIPQLSPTHTQGRIVRWHVKNGQEVNYYDPAFVLECSPDFLTRGNRNTAEHAVSMIVEVHEQGVIRGVLAEQTTGQWMDVGTEVGTVDDGEPCDGDWIWQAYKV